jgi:hypothetical protein
MDNKKAGKCQNNFRKMKKYTFLISILFLATMLIVNCSKNDSAAKDYSASIKDKTWWGSLAYTGKDAEYYSVHFNADNSLLWSQLSGDYSGHWAVTDKTITMTFDINSAQIKADITDNDRLSNITDNTEFYEIITGAIIANPGIILDNTEWIGVLYNKTSSTSQTLQFSFMQDLKVEIKVGIYSRGIFSYKRSASGAVIKDGKGMFCIVTSGNEMKGSDASPTHPFQATKQ